MALSLFSADQGYLDDLDIAKVVPFERELLAYFKENYQDVIDKINNKPELSDEISKVFKEIISKFKTTQSW